MNKIKKSERAVLTIMALTGSYINVGDVHRTNCTVYIKGLPGPQLQFRQSTLLSLRIKGLLDGKNEITTIGGEAAIKGYYK